MPEFFLFPRPIQLDVSICSHAFPNSDVSRSPLGMRATVTWVRAPQR